MPSTRGQEKLYLLNLLPFFLICCLRHQGRSPVLMEAENVAYTPMHIYQITCCHVQRTDVGKYSFVNTTIKGWNQLPAGLLASFRCKLNTFSKRAKNVVTGKGTEVGIVCE
jgi:hypothetical protein